MDCNGLPTCIPFIKVIRLLYESVIGEGFEKTFLKDWGGFDVVANFNNTRSDFIKITYECFNNIVKRVIKTYYKLREFQIIRIADNKILYDKSRYTLVSR